jgi:hypothetical protein
MATFIKDLKGFRGTAKLWQLNNGDYVVTSYVRDHMAHETMAFRSNENGRIANYDDLASRRGYEAHSELVEELENN